MPNSNTPGTNLYGSTKDIVLNCWIALKDENGFAMIAKCTGTPPVTANIFQHGCLMNQTNTTSGNAALYQNVGSTASPVWSLLDIAGVLPPETIAYNADATAGALTIVAAKMVNAILDRNGGSANRTDITDTATNIVAAISGAEVGSAFYFYVRNTSATAGETITLTGGTGVTISSDAVVPSGAYKLFIGRVTNAGSPAVTLYPVSVANATGTAAAQTWTAGGSAITATLNGFTGTTTGTTTTITAGGAIVAAHALAGGTVTDGTIETTILDNSALTATTGTITTVTGLSATITATGKAYQIKGTNASSALTIALT